MRVQAAVLNFIIGDSYTVATVTKLPFGRYANGISGIFQSPNVRKTEL